MIFADNDWNNALRVEIYILIIFTKIISWAVYHFDSSISFTAKQHFNASKLSNFDKIDKQFDPETVLHSLKPNFDLSIVIPYRNRSEQLKYFLNKMETYINAQGLDPMFMIVEQSDKNLFNRGKLLNIGYLETKKLAKVGCYTFHDVDILPSSYCDYSCYKDPRGTPHPRAFAVYLSKWNYTHQPWPGFGGVTQMNEDHMAKTNGNPNRFFGWGGEDGVMYVRLLKAGLQRSEVPSSCRFEAAGT